MLRPLPARRTLLPLLTAALVGTVAAAPARADDPVAPVVTISDATVVEGDGKGTSIAFPITVSNFTGSVTLAIATRPDSALGADDFTPRLSVFTIPSLGGPNSNYRFEVSIVGDQVFEPTESFT
ncbi:MAG: hypothetical protein JHC95_08180, partial [Solirubrobacteraceae bacterium]|nr:hypothetical protein [Solirubrobacteraceae bacterium]